MPTFPDALKAALAKRRLTHLEAAQLLGLSRKHVTEMCNGHADPRLSTVLRIRTVLGLNLNALKGTDHV